MLIRLLQRCSSMCPSLLVNLHADSRTHVCARMAMRACLCNVFTHVHAPALYTSQKRRFYMSSVLYVHACLACLYMWVDTGQTSTHLTAHMADAQVCTDTCTHACTHACTTDAFLYTRPHTRLAAVRSRFVVSRFGKQELSSTSLSADNGATAW